MPTIHPTAVVDPQATLADDVTIGPYCIVEGAVNLGPGSKLIAHCYLKGPLTMGLNNQVYPYATLGMEPQDRKADPDNPGPGTIIGDDNIFREGVSVHRATHATEPTRIGDRNYFMSNSHVAHDCIVASDCMLANNALLGGHCIVSDRVIMGGNSAAQQFSRIGRLAMLGGCEGITADLPPFCMVHHTKQVSALNLIGLRRAGLREHIRPLRDCFNILYRQGYTTSKALTVIKDKYSHDPICLEFADFIEASTNGITGYGESFKHRPWLKPEFYDPQDEDTPAAVQ